jgi:hypothetical protein
MPAAGQPVASGPQSAPFIPKDQRAKRERRYSVSCAAAVPGADAERPTRASRLVCRDQLAFDRQAISIAVQWSEHVCRQLGVQSRSRTGRGCDVQPAAYCLDPVDQAAKARPACRVGAADAVI